MIRELAGTSSNCIGRVDNFEERSLSYSLRNDIKTLAKIRTKAFVSAEETYDFRASLKQNNMNLAQCYFMYMCNHVLKISFASEQSIKIVKALISDFNDLGLVAPRLHLL